MEVGGRWRCEWIGVGGDKRVVGISHWLIELECTPNDRHILLKVFPTWFKPGLDTFYEFFHFSYASLSFRATSPSNGSPCPGQRFSMFRPIIFSSESMASRWFREKLGLGGFSSPLELSRLSPLNNVPVSVSNTHILPGVCPGVCIILSFPMLSPSFSVPSGLNGSNLRMSPKSLNPTPANPLGGGSLLSPVT